MIVGVGCDIVRIGRLEKKQAELATKILTPNEKMIYDAYPKARRLEYLAGRFAAKEAIFKALHLTNVTLSQIEVLQDEQGKPICEMAGFTIHISISHENEYALAYAMCEK